jgi:hypothetical protein
MGPCVVDFRVLCCPFVAHRCVHEVGVTDALVHQVEVDARRDRGISVPEPDADGAASRPKRRLPLLSRPRRSDERLRAHSLFFSFTLWTVCSFALVAHQFPFELGPPRIRPGQLVRLNGDQLSVWLRAGVQLVFDLNAHLASRGHRCNRRQEIPTAIEKRWPVRCTSTSRRPAPG